jgi:hypothetical protein
MTTSIMGGMPENLRNEFLELIEKGDEAQARAFLIENLKQFSQDTQDAITMAFVEEALLKKNSDDALVEDLQTKGLAMAKAMAKGQEELEKHAKLAEIKENL